MAVNSWALATLEDLKMFIPSDEYEIKDEPGMEMLISQVSSFMERETGRKLKARTYDYAVTADSEDAIGDGDGTTIFYTKQYPINSITTLLIGDDTVAAAANWDEDGYFIYKNQGKIYYEDGFDKYVKNVKLKYNAGYEVDTPEYDQLNLICCILVKYIWDNKDQLGFSSEQIGRYRYTRANFKAADPWLWDSLQSYKRRIFA